MSIGPGARLGPYEVTARIGAGGMGQVYRARDTRLDRIVAIKVLPPELAASPEFRERFDREAKAIASLSHPHICTVYDVGRHDTADYLVLEYLQGETLNDRLARGALGMDQALQIGAQIADALARAHRAGIVHRDVKPGNVMLTASGAKLLDFGLAKATGTCAAAPSATLLPTTPPNLTMQGMLLGTSHYMAPEQVEGNEADARSDIFALGVVLYEMLSGSRPFTGKSLAHLHAAILEHQPEPLAVRQPAVPSALVRTVSKCLAKNPEERWQHAADLADELRWIAAGNGAPAVTPSAARPPAPWFRTALAAWLVAGMLGVAAAALAASALLRPDAEVRELQVDLAIPAPNANAIFRRLALSPDGRTLAFTAPDERRNVALWVRDLASGTVRMLPGTEGAVGPFWSPDSRTIAFATSRELKRVDAAGGLVDLICRLPLPAAESFARGSWNRDGTIIFAPTGVSALWRVDANGGEPSALTDLATEGGELGHRFPSFLPDQRRFIYLTLTVSGRSVVYAGSLDSDQRVRLIEDVDDIQFASDHLLFVRGTTLLAQRLDLATLEMSGRAIQIADGVLTGSGAVAGAVFSVSSAGELIYAPGTLSESSRIVWMNREGTITSVVADAAPHQDLFLSQDGRFASVSKPAEGPGSPRDIWIIDTSNGRPRKLTVDSGNELEGIWSFTGDRILYNADRAGVLNLYARSSRGAGAEQEILVDGVDKFPQAWSPDGEYAIYLTFADKTGQDLWLLPVRTGRPEPLLRTDANEPSASFSPDGRWILYWSAGHVYVMPFRREGGPWQISTEAGGGWPRWSQNGREIIYLSGSTFMSAAVNCGADTCEVESVRPLFEREYYGPGRWSYGVAPDGRILTLVSDGQTANQPLTLLVNWPARLSRAN